MCYLEAVKRALKIIDDTVKKANKIKVRFQYVHDETNVQKLSIDVDETGTGKNPHDVTQDPSGLLTEDNITYCYYEKELNRNAICRLQSVVVKNGEDKKCGKELVLNTKLLFNGAVIFIKMPTEENDSIKCPTIESVITKSTGLIEDSETRTVIEKLLADSIYDDTLRDKLRVILMLDKGEKNTIVKEFLAKVGNGSENLKSEDFKQFITTKSDEFLARNERQFDEFINSIKINQDELKGVISNAISKIDLRSLWNANAEIKSEIQNLIEALKSWQDQQRKFEKKNAKEAQVQYNCLINKIEQSNQTIEELYEIFKSQSDQLSKLSTDITWIRAWLENADRRRMIKNLLYGGATVLCLLFLLFIIILSISTGPTVNNSNWMSKIAHSWLGNKDVAYERAKFLEDNKKYPEAAEWYMLARERYADILKDNPSDSVRAMRMTEMSMRGKGGIINTDTAEYYAHLAKRYDLEAYLAVVNGNVYKSKEIVNSYQSTRSPYFDLADALSSLLYPKDHSAEEIKLCWEIVDSLASTKNQATPEAINCAFSICSDGVKDKNENYIVAPSLYDAIAYAKDADTHYNSINAQIYLASRFMSLHLRQDAEKYHNKAKENNVFGCGEITFSHKRINELTDDPQALVAKAHYNAQKGYTDYRMTGYYYHIADSINKVRRIYKLGMEFYKDWYDFIVNAEDIKSIDQILHLINREYPDSLRIGIAEYVMALKYSNGKGVSLDSEKSGEHLKRAASSGLEDAQVALSILLDIDSIPEGIENLKKLAFRNSPNPSAARYLMSKEIKKDTIIPELLKRSDDEFALLIKLNILKSQDLSRLSRETLLSIKQQINIVLSNKTDFSDSAFLLGKLAEIVYLMGYRDEADFYITLADRISPKDAYSSYFGISEIARKSGDITNAAYFAGRFARLYFLDNGKVLYEPERSNVVSHIYHLYPESLDIVKEKTGYDFEKNTYFFIDGNFEKDRNPMTFESPVKNLRIELPNYEKFTFPVTMKYFD